MYHVVLVDPQTPGNVGAVARAMKNFGLHRLHLVDPCPLDDEAWKRALSARDVLEDAAVYGSFEEAARRLDYLAGFTSETANRSRDHLRTAFSLEDFVERVQELEGDIGLVFGRESDGLNNEEVARCDAVVSIPTSPEYASMNLSHAVTVALYALRAGAYEPHERRPTSAEERDVLHETFDALLDAIGMPEHQQTHTRRMFRRVMGRAMPSTWEFHRFMGVLSGALKRLDAWPVKARRSTNGGKPDDDEDL